MTARNTVKAPVSERALTQRLSRRLAQDGRKLHHSRAGRGKIKQPGEWFITDAMDKIDQWAMTLTELGREYGVLHGYEELVG
jgi:hypothetical protein